MFKLMGKEIDAVLCAHSILIWTFGENPVYRKGEDEIKARDDLV